MIYIQKTIGFWSVEEVLPVSYRTGMTLEDYENDAYIPLSEEQEQFHHEHPDATPSDCWNMVLTPVPEQPVPPPVPAPDALAASRWQKLHEIAEQDTFSNKFFVSVTQGGVEVANQELWIDKDLRNSLYSITLPALLSDGETKTRLWTTVVPRQPIEVPIAWAMGKLPLLEIYAKRTYDLRASNEAAAYAATTEDELAQIDPKAGYPHFLTFELNLDLGA